MSASLVKGSHVGSGGVSPLGAALRATRQGRCPLIMALSRGPSHPGAPLPHLVGMRVKAFSGVASAVEFSPPGGPLDYDFTIRSKDFKDRTVQAGFLSSELVIVLCVCVCAVFKTCLIFVHCIIYFLQAALGTAIFAMKRRDRNVMK